MSNIVDLVLKGGTAVPLAAPSPSDFARTAQPERKGDLAAPTGARELIAYLADRKIRGFCGTIDDQGEYLSNVYKENRSLSAHVTADYHGRFLLELIQNGYDIHPRERSDGEIEVLLDVREEEHGTLYVANRGGGFTADNVNALCDIGMSSKPPGEAIGNKGLGFRSVHHVADAPEIYSQTDPIGAKPSFDGFCFSFADDATLDAMLPDPRHRELARQDLPHFHVPRWLSEQPGHVLEFARRGFATVVRLPLRDPAALKAVHDELGALRAQTAPVLLFLKRLRCLTVRMARAGPDGGDIAVPLRRSETPVGDPRLALSTVDLDSAGTFLIARRAVGETAMKTAIQSGVASKQLHPSWEGWKGEGEVALAVRLDPGPVSPRLYTFLPMGKEATAPFNGFLHGTFFPSSSRKALDSGVELNRLILTEATALAADAVVQLSRFTPPSSPDGANRLFDAAAGARAVVDLLVWREVAGLDGDGLALSSAVALKTASALGAGSLDDAPVIPCLGAWSGDPLTSPLLGSIVWRRAREARRWQLELPTFSVEVIANHGNKVGIAPLWPGLGAARIESLRAYLAANLDRPQDQPTPDERAGIAASVAAAIPRGKRPALSQWAAFYRDLVPFMERNVSPLAGLEILLCGDGSLRPAKRQITSEGEARAPRRRRRKGVVVEASVFAPPAPRGSNGPGTVAGDELLPPAALEPHFAFLAEALPWYAELASVRSLFEGKLIDAFDSDTVLARLSQVLVSDRLKETRASGLRWAFLIWRRAQESGRPIQLRAHHRFYVPTADGDYIEARDAIFSATWPEETQGKRLQQFLDLVPADCPDLNAVRARRLAPRSDRAFGKSRMQQWVSFLTELGVQRGLEPVEKKVARHVRAYELSDFRFCEALGMSDTAVEVWKADISATVQGGTSFTYSTEYVISGSLWWMPGQGDQARFSDDCRELYAALIADWVGRAKSGCWSVEVHHHFARTSDSRQWPTPLASFIRASRWMPADEPSPEGPVRSYFAPKDIWLASQDGPERFPPFLRRPAAKLLRALERDQGPVRELVRRAGLRILHDPSSDLEQASFLAEQYRNGRVDRYHEREFLNLYHRTWRSIADRHVSLPVDRGAVDPPAYIVARCDGSNITVDIGASQGADSLHVRDNEDEIAPRLIELTGGQLFDARAPDPGRIGRVFKAFYGARVRLVSDVDYELLVGTTPISKIECKQTVMTICPWLRVMTAVSLEALKGADFQRLPPDRSSLIARLEQVGWYCAGSIVFRINEREIPAEQAQRRAFALKMVDGRAIVVALHEGEVTWATVEASLQAICEAIEQPSLVPHMRLLARELAEIGDDAGAAPTGDFELERLCRVLLLDSQAVAAARETLGARLDRHLPWLRAIVHFAGGDDALAAFGALEGDAVQDIGRLRAALSSLISEFGLDTDAVLAACKHSFSVGELRESLGLDFAKFNASLIAAGLSADIDPERHQAQVTHYITERAIAVIDALRNAFAPVLLVKSPAPDYARLRDALPNLQPDPSWLLVHQDLPERLLDAFLAKWLAEAGAPPLGANPYDMPALQRVRAVNVPAVRKFAEAAAPLVRTWCRSNARTVPELWRDDLLADAKLRAALDNVGAFDFLPLDETALVKWSSALGAWPDGMSHTLDRETLGITSTDVEEEREKAKAERAEREAQARSVSFNGRKIDPVGADWDAISAEIQAGLSRATLSISLGSQADLRPVTRLDRTPERRDPKKDPGEPAPRAPHEKKEMIGRLGEVVVYHWLKKRLPEQDIDKAWRSKNAAFVTGQPGEDDLGYDFEVKYRKQTWLIEVKASTGDPQRFEMGESEVHAARKAAHPRSATRYVIAYVRNVGEPGETVIEMLPNPMTDEGSKVLEIVGEGIRYGFRRR